MVQNKKGYTSSNFMLSFFRWGKILRKGGNGNESKFSLWFIMKYIGILNIMKIILKFKTLVLENPTKCEKKKKWEKKYKGKK